jgi:hypothetical protein
MPDHPVRAQLLKQIEAFRLAGFTGITIDPYVIEHGRPFTGIKRPKGYRQRAEKWCFHNAAMLALEGRGTYVEGYAIPLGDKFLCHHAWITTGDGCAVDVTWHNPEQAAYFGVPIPSTVLAKRFLAKLLFHDLLSPLQRIVFGK